MLRFRHIAVVLAVGTFASGCATRENAPPPPTPAQILADASANDFTCTRAGVTDVSFARFSLTPLVYVDKCVRLKGLATFRYLYKDGSAIPAQKNAAVAPSTIGIYWKDDGAMRKLDAGAQFVEIVGRVRDCAARNKLLHAAGISELGPCQNVAIAVFVSQNHIFPTAMD